MNPLIDVYDQTMGIFNSQILNLSEGKQKMIQQKTEVTGYFKVSFSTSSFDLTLEVSHCIDSSRLITAVTGKILSSATCAANPLSRCFFLRMGGCWV
jgi:hypothetical protein